MKARIILFNVLLSFLFISVSYAQKAYEPSKAGDNWFLHLGAGGQTIFGDNDDKADFQKRITVMPTVSAGKWFSPYWGLRAKGQGGSLHGFENEGLFMQHDKYYNVHLDALWNLSNQLGGYSSTRVLNITPYVGLGFAHRFELNTDVAVPQATGVQPNYRESANAISVNGGLQFGFRLNKRISLDFDLGAAMVPDYFDRVVNHAENEAIVSASGGLTFKLGKTDFEVIEPMDRGLIEDLNSRINTLHAKNKELSAELAGRPVNCPQCPPAAPVVSPLSSISYIPNVVFFQINSAKVDDNQQISIFNTAEFMNESREKIKVVGYADKDTGTDKYNLQLSEKRAKAVANELITKYKIPSQHIIVEWKGSEEQPYKEKNWNRVVIMIPQ
ncbi:MAG: OmpA family protein [Candidatus Symbiothrix sp.]|jgi:outer membrane protein OmpA-like peptidoglycan-associated protein|nr:OmpA family protein [Candidatus Symbiothrix sp.]